MVNRILAALMALALCLPLPSLANDISNSTWSETDASNNGASPTGWTSGSMLPSQVEPTARAMMGGIKRFYDHINATVTSGGAANVQTLTYTVAPAAYVSGDCYAFIAGFTNTAATTLNVSALGAKNIKIGSTALAGNEIIATRSYLVCYDGTQFQLMARPEVNGQHFGTNAADDGAGGVVGEYATANRASGAALGLATGTPADVTSMNLTAGDWDVSGSIVFAGGATTTVTFVEAGINTTSATMPSLPTTAISDVVGAGATLFNSGAVITNPGPVRISLSGTTTVYLVGQANFGTSTATAYGIIRARRVR